MRRPDDIFGFTLGELSFLLLFSLVIIFALTVTSVDTEEKDYLKQLEEANKKILELEAEKNKLLKKIKKPDLRSKQMPSCIETGYKKDYFGKIKILGADTYLYDEEIYSFKELIKHLLKDLEDAKANECILSVRVSFDKNVLISDYDTALRKIERYFYVTRFKLH